MAQKSPPSVSLSLNRPPRLILNEASLGDPQAKLRLSPKRLRLYASDTTHDARENRDKAGNYRSSYDVLDEDDDRLQAPLESSLDKCFSSEHDDDKGRPERECIDNVNDAFASPPRSPASLCSSKLHSSGFEQQDWNCDVGPWAKATKFKPRRGLVFSDTNDDDRSSFDNLSLNSIPETWKPPKPRKPSFLAAQFVSTAASESIAEDSQHRWLYTLPTSAAKQQLQLQRDRDMGITKGSESGCYASPNWDSKANCIGKGIWPSRRPAKKVTWRPFPRLPLHNSPDRPYRLPLNDEEQPFPMPIPTMDKLPLRPEFTLSRSIDVEDGIIQQDVSSTNTPLGSLHSRLHPTEKTARIWDDLKAFALVTFSVLEFKQPKSSSPGLHSFRVAMAWEVTSLDSDGSCFSNHQRKVDSWTSMDCVVSLLHLNITVPVPLLRMISLVATALENPNFPRVKATVSKFGKVVVVLILIFVLWLLKKIRRFGRKRTR